MMLKIYRFITSYLSFCIDIYLVFRLFKGKEDPSRFKERFGKSEIPRPKGSLIWFHAASIGESVSILPLINKIYSKYPSVKILVTTGTLTSSRIMEQRLPKNVIHQFIPVDKLSSVRRFLEHWRPDLALWVESELWPNLIIETERTGCKIILVNGRISKESHQKWLRFHSVSKQILSKFSLCLVQTEEDEKRYRELGAAEVAVGGNLKYDSPPLPGDPAELWSLISQIGSRDIWVAASTHDGEDEMILRAHKKLKERFPDILTILIPRHPKRAKDIITLLKQYNLTYAQRSNKEKITEKIDIYLADTIGEIGSFYRLSGIVFMGGSIVDHGGQNPLEPARLDCAILTGEHYFNFTEIYNDMIAKEAAILIKTENELFYNLEKLLSDIKLRKEFSYKAYEYAESKKGILRTYLNNIGNFIKPLTMFNV